MTDYGKPIIGFIIVLVICGISFVSCNQIKSDCEAMGGHIKWLYGKSTNYLCLSKDGRIIG